MKNFGILVLAAGQSRRFGSDKLMAKMPDGRPVIAHSLEPLLTFAQENHQPLCVITRADNPVLIDYLTLKDINFSISPNAHLGMGHSIADGVKSNPDWQGWLIALADMPNIPRSLLNNLWHKIQSHKERIIRPLLSSGHQKIPAHPVYFPASYREALQNLTGDNGAKKLMDNLLYLTHIDNQLIDESMMIDVDTKDRLIALHKQKERIT